MEGERRGMKRERTGAGSVECENGAVPGRGCVLFQRSAFSDRRSACDVLRAALQRRLDAQGADDAPFLAGLVKGEQAGGEGEGGDDPEPPDVEEPGEGGESQGQDDAGGAPNPAGDLPAAVDIGGQRHPAAPWKAKAIDIRRRGRGQGCEESPRLSNGSGIISGSER